MQQEDWRAKSPGVDGVRLKAWGYARQAPRALNSVQVSQVGWQGVQELPSQAALNRELGWEWSSQDTKPVFAFGMPVPQCHPVDHFFKAHKIIYLEHGKGIELDVGNKLRKKNNYEERNMLNTSQ